MAKARTIQIFLPDGNPRGVKIAEITNRTIQTILIPRASVDFALSRPELNNVGVYFLVGESEDVGKPIVYIGETENCFDRLRQHNKNKDFWQHGLVVISKTKSFTKASARYLEWYCIEQAKKANRYKLENDSIRKKTHLSESAEADLLDNFEDIKILTSTVGYNIFGATEQRTKQDVLYCKAKGTVAKGLYTEEGFVVFKSSTCSLTITKGFRPAMRRMRETLCGEGILIEQNGFLVFTEDYTFTSPSAAATMISGNATNGWDAWKYKNGKTLDEVKRQG